MDYQKIYELYLHEETVINNKISVIRVPGGWIYHNIHLSVFIAFNKEFQELKK